MIPSYAGKLLRVDLTRRKVVEQQLHNSIVKKYIGGIGIAAHILYTEVPSWASAFDASNLLIFSTGALSGTPVPCTSRLFVVTKSPLTNCFCDSAAGGFWAPELKFAGYDAIIISGRASEPVFLWIHEDEVEIKNAKDYWGMDARKTDIAIKRDFDDKRIQVADIGQGGEKLVLFATIMTDEAGRAAARCGVGAVMGFKNLKAVAVRGHQKLPLHDEKSLREYNTRLLKRFKEDDMTQWFRNYSSPGYFSGSVESGDASIKNWRGGKFKRKKISYPGGYSKVVVGRSSCYNCPLACRTKVTVSDGPYQVEGKVEGLEFETLAALGSNCCIDDMNALVKANDLCNLYGIDTISVGGVIAFAMECYENGLFTTDDTDGIEVTWGNASALLELIEKIAFRRGVGNLLAEGSARAASMIGQNAHEYAIHVKRLEVPMHDPRTYQGFSLTYACSPVGADHMEGELFAEQLYSPLLKDIYSKLGIDLNVINSETIAQAIVKIQNLWHVIGNAMGYCLFPSLSGCTDYPLQYNIKLFNFATGFNLSLEDIMKVGERIYNLKKLFNIKHNISNSEDTLPKRFLKEPVSIGPSKGKVSQLEELLPKYYKFRGWDPITGKPSKQKLRELSLEKIVNNCIE